MAYSGFIRAIVLALCICTALSAFASYPRANWMQMERIEPAKDTQSEGNDKSRERLVKSVLKDLLQRMSQSLDSPPSAQKPKKQLSLASSFPRDELKRLANVPEEVHQKWEHFKQTYCTPVFFFNLNLFLNLNIYI